MIFRACKKRPLKETGDGVQEGFRLRLSCAGSKIWIFKKKSITQQDLRQIAVLTQGSVRLYSVCLCDFGGSILLIVILIEVIAPSKIKVTLDNCSKKWYNIEQGDEKNWQMLYDEARVLLIESCEKTHNAEEIAKIFGWLIASIIL